MIYQTNRKLSKYFNRYGCLFTSIAYARPFLGGKDWTAQELQEKWNKALKEGILSGDLNNDGDFDDAKELEIQDYPRLLKLLEVPLEWIPGHHNPAMALVGPLFAVGAFFNPRTKFTHFAVVDHTKKVIFDPIEGGSVTCREGYLKSLRLFSVKES